MKTPPKIINTQQVDIHKNLRAIVQKHIDHPFLQPKRQHNIDVFNALKKLLSNTEEGARHLDSCCGTGMSTYYIASQHQKQLVIGIDQSEVRLSKQHNHAAVENTKNLHFIRCNCEDIWRLIVENAIRFETHTIFYPNPYPKSTHIKRRWHGHPVFPYLPKIAEKTIVRSNWRLYLEEFSYAWKLVTGIQPEIKQISVSEPITLFEKKYTENDQAVFELVAFNSE